MSTPQPITNVKAKLLGENGNAYYILGKVCQALRDAGYDKAFIDDYITQATSGDYDTLLQTTMAFVKVE
ncbi:MAG TPA: hypothetical protein ENN79_16305 [Desulfobacteraceae bacterium]|nr:hypothetical protein [Desulfobacteraceae bacterium]